MWLLSLMLSCEALTDLRFTEPDAMTLLGDCPSPDAAVTLYEDADGDGYGDDLIVGRGCLPVEGWSDLPGDCADTDPSIHVGQTEACNGVDDDCDFAVDEAPERLWCADVDGDDYGDPGDGVHACDQPHRYIEDCSDCDDDDDTVNPGAAEVPTNGVDDDCDLAVDE